MPTKHWAGAVLFLIGIWLITTAWRRRSRALNAYRAAKAEGQELYVGTSAKFAMTNAIVRPIVFVVLLAAALEVVGAFAAMGESRLFSYIDVGGFLFALLAFGVNFSISTKYRDFPPVAKHS